MRRWRDVTRVFALAWQVLWGATLLGFRVLLNDIQGRRETRASIAGRTLADVFEFLGPTYTKLGQILSTRHDLFAPLFIQQLERLRDDLSPLPFPAVPLLLRQEFGLEVQEAFSQFDTSPIASASIASVYRAKLHDGRVVAVKVLRPGIAGRIESDLHVLRLAVRLLSHLPSLRLVPLRPVVDEFGTCMQRQVDFQLEAAAHRRLRTALSWQPGIVVPALVEELCSSSILTMEFVEGLHDVHHLSAENAQKALLAAFRALYRMIFVEGIIHCDLHQGNLHFLPDGRAVLLDFGFMADFERADRLTFAQFFYAMAVNDGVHCAQLTLQAASATPPDLDYKAFESEVVALVTRVAGASAGSFHVANFVFGLFEIQRRFRIVGTTTPIMAIISLLVLEGIAKDVHADLDFQREALPFILQGSIRSMRPEKVERASTKAGEPTMLQKRPLPELLL
jgi:ubiquinone biosynthesis protein